MERSSNAQVPARALEIGLVTQILSKPLQHADIRPILSALCTSDQQQFVSRIADLLQRVSALLDAYHRISEFVSVELLLQRLGQIISEVITAEQTMIFLHDTDAGELFTPLSVEGKEIRVSSSCGVPGVVFNAGEAIVIENASLDPRFESSLDDATGFRTRNLLCVPLRNKRKKIIGVTQVANKRTGSFTTEDQVILEAITTQAAAALEHARRDEIIERVRREEKTLLEVTTAICTELQIDPLLTKITEVAANLLDAERSTVFVHDSKNRTLWTRAAIGLDGSKVEIPDTAGIAGLVFSTGEPLNVPDAYQHPRFNPAIDTATGYRTRNLLSMPIINKFGKVIGVTQVLNKRKGSFTSEDERRLRALTAQAAIALENAKLHQQLLMQERIRRDLATARQIQQSFLPKIVPTFSGATIDLVGELHPAQEVSGDFYDYVDLDDRRLAITVADVSGKGMPAALFMTIVRSHLRELIRTERSPARILSLLNDALARDNPAFMFVTVILAVCDVRTWRCTLARAGHPPAILTHRNGTARELTDARGSLLGIQSPCPPMTEISFALDPGDCLFFYTDGVTEAAEPKHGHLFGTGRLLDVMRTISPSVPLRQACQTIRREIRSFTDAVDFQDDLTLLLLRRTG